MNEHDPGLDDVYAELQRKWARRTPLNLLYEYSDRDERAYVDDPPRVRWIVLRSFAWIALGFVALIGIAAENALGDTGATLVIAFVIGRAAFITQRRAQSYRNGWAKGRRDLVIHLTEAGLRDERIDDFLRLESRRDLEVFLRGL